MSSKLKKLIIIAVIVLVLGLGSLFVYSSISSASDVTITDFRILDNKNNIMQDRDVFLGETSTNNFKIVVDVEPNKTSGGFHFYSTDTKVAKVVERNDGYYVEYYLAGETQIIAQSNTVANVKDSFKLTVHENIAIDLEFVNSADNTGKAINVFADNREYSYKYNLKGIADDHDANASSLRIVDDYNHDIFRKVEIDPENNNLKIIVNSSVGDQVVQSGNEFIKIQSFARDNDGNAVVIKNFVIKANIIGNVIEDMQLIVSSTPDFIGNTYVYSVKENKLVQEDEILVDKIYLNSVVNTIYVRVRLVFTNKQFMEITPNVTLNIASGQGTLYKFDDYVSITISQNVEYRILYSGTLSAGESIDERFSFNFVNGDLPIEALYTKKGSFYVYTYFDTRFERADAIVDENGNIVGFSGLM